MKNLLILFAVALAGCGGSSMLPVTSKKTVSFQQAKAHVGKPPVQQLKGHTLELESVSPLMPDGDHQYHVVKTSTRPVIDGALDEWSTVSAIRLDQKQQSGGDWEGPEDLSGSLKMMWDDGGLYFALEVVDDKHVAENAKRSFWANDCFQFAFDPHLNGPKGSFDIDEISLCVTDSPKGPIMATYRKPGIPREVESLIKDQVVKMTVRDGTRFYEWRVAWKDLSTLSPWVLGSAGFSCSINDNDGKGFEGALVWTKGLIWGQDASRFGRIIFDGAVGSRDAMLGLRPEVNVLDEQASSRWLNTKGVSPFATARLLVRKPGGGPVKAGVIIYPAGEDEPIARGNIVHNVSADRSVLFAWDLSGLPAGQYELVYEAPAVQSGPTPRLAFHHITLGRPMWVAIDGVVHGAQADKRGPIGGGKGYAASVRKGDFTVRNLDELLDALSKAKAGQTVFIPGETTIDLTAQIYVEQLVLKVPGGVTLAGDRGWQGSKGALLSSDALKTPVMIQIMGPDARVTGLRIRGPNPKRYLGHHQRAFGTGGGKNEYYYKFPTSDGIRTDHARLEVDNCEISGFAHAAIYLLKGKGHQIHHNYIHHCQYKGLGYGVCHDRASSVIEQNLFNWNRHSIAGTGRPGCGYVARHNIELGISLSHCFDMHGGSDRKDGTNVAGTITSLLLIVL